LISPFWFFKKAISLSLSLSPLQPTKKKKTPSFIPPSVPNFCFEKMMNDFPRLYGNQQEKPFEPSMPISTAMQEAGGAIDELRKELPQYDAATAAMMRHLQILTQAVETVQQHCSNVMQERDQYSSMLTVAQQRLTEVQRVVQRYTVVQDPVVASDGFTYERRTIQQYIDDCARTRAAPVSQQTREELTNTLVPNQSLKKLVDLLKSVKADAPMPQAGNKDHGSSGGADLLHGGGGYHAECDKQQQ
jgi:prefoldin subunit 5